MRSATNSAKRHGVAGHPSLEEKRIQAEKAVAYAAGVLVFEDATTEHAAGLAREKVAALEGEERKLAEEKARSAAQRIEVSRFGLA